MWQNPKTPWVRTADTLAQLVPFCSLNVFWATAIVILLRNGMGRWIWYRCPAFPFGTYLNPLPSDSHHKHNEFSFGNASFPNSQKRCRYTWSLFLKFQMCLLSPWTAWGINAYVSQDSFLTCLSPTQTVFVQSKSINLSRLDFGPYF